MKRFVIVMVCAFLAAGLGWTKALASEDSVAEGSVTVGGSWTMDDIDDDESGAKGTEYNSLVSKDANWDLGGGLSIRAGMFNLDADAHYQDGDDQEYGAALDLNRYIVYKTDYNRFLHRLDHDEMENLVAHIFSAPGKGLFVDFNNDGTNNKNAEIVGSAAVYHTDFGLGDEYEITRSEWNNHVKVNLPQIPGLTLGFDHRMEKREGTQQARTMSKCSACHVVGVSKDVEEVTNDYSPKATLRIGPVALEYSYMHREFDDKSDDLSLVYNALATSHLGFTNRLQYDDRTGALPFSRTPDTEKDTHSLKARWDVAQGQVVTAGFIYSKSTNLETDGKAYNPLTGEFNEDLEMDSSTFMAKYHGRLGHHLSVTVHGKYQTIDGDEVYVDVVDRANGDGTTLGDGYGTSTLGAAEGLATGYWDYTRRSGYDLDLSTLGFDVAFRPMRGLTLKGGYEFHYEERDNYESHDVPEDTTEHTIKLGADWRMNHALRLNLGYTFQLIDDPYSLYNAVCAPDGSYGEYGGPPGSLYDYSRSYDPRIYSQREGTRSNQPTSVHELAFKANWTPVQMVTTSMHAKYKYANNDDVDGRDWQQDMFAAGFNVVLTPSENMVFAAGYNYFNDKYESMYCIAIYDG